MEKLTKTPEIILPNRRRFLKAAAGAAIALPCIRPADAFILALFEGIAVHGARIIAGLLFNAYRTVAVAVRFVVEEAAEMAIEHGIQHTMAVAGTASKTLPKKARDVANSVAKEVAEGVIEYGVDAGMAYFFDERINLNFAFYPDLAKVPFEKDFDFKGYRKSVIQVHPVSPRMSDEEYRAYRMQDKKIILSRLEDEDRFEVLAKYLVDHKVRILPPNANTTTKITAQSQPIDYFSGDLIFPDARDQHHYQELISLTGVDVFNLLRA